MAHQDISIHCSCSVRLGLVDTYSNKHHMITVGGAKPRNVLGYLLFMNSR